MYASSGPLKFSTQAGFACQYIYFVSGFDSSLFTGALGCQQNYLFVYVYVCIYFGKRCTSQTLDQV